MRVDGADVEAEMPDSVTIERLEAAPAFTEDDLDAAPEEGIVSDPSARDGEREPASAAKITEALAGVANGYRR
jgi:hypothetical protein